jgi:demethylspheroidene O-methyltransferase
MPLAAGTPALSGPERSSGVGDRILAFRDRLVSSPRFHRWAARFPLTRPIARRQTKALFDLCAGFVYAQVLAACLRLNLFEILAEGPLGAEELGCRLGLEPDPTGRLLTAAVSLRLLDRRSGGRFGLGLLGAATLGQPGIGAMVAHHAALYADLADPVALLRRGGRGSELSRYWPYATGSATPNRTEVEPYTRLMSVSQPFVAEQVLDAYPIGQHRRLLDIGGGDGTFLAAAARRASTLELVLFDLQPVAAMAEARFARDGLASRATVVGGDFHSDPLPTGCDVASLVRIIHDHDDAPALAILCAAYKALPAGGTLLLAEPMADGNGPVCDVYFSFYLLAMGSGRPRTAAELTRMLEQVGFRAVRVVPTDTPMLAGLIVAQRPV